MRLNHRKKFYINDDCGSQNKYIEILNWLRTMGSLNGSVFEGIANLNWCEGFPLVEIEVLTPKGISTKFIIAKNSLYLIAFCADDQ
ncbi:unnamed protein product [Cuscuta epithymum]|uniref:Uncharacterized protein n=1 Tax=Cuscuta epithymum TaxID=186058 RepID=A0AAV0CMJ5_9ASTE|nr:unnamed protein product [Cuscuta epithymum]